MLVRYHYYTFRNENYGEFVVDVEDFRAFCKSRLPNKHYRSRPEDVCVVYAIFEDGRSFVWHNYDLEDDFGCIKGGWTVIR